MKLIKIFSLIVISIALATSCASKITEENAMEHINQLPEYQTPFYAPINIGKIVVTGEENKNAAKVINDSFQKLIDADMVEVIRDSKNVWSTSFNVVLTDKAKDICDPRRTTDKKAYMPVCIMVPTKLISLQENSDTTMLCKFIIEQKEITIFGDYLGFKSEVEHEMSYSFPNK